MHFKYVLIFYCQHMTTKLDTWSTDGFTRGGPTGQ